MATKVKESAPAISQDDFVTTLQANPENDIADSDEVPTKDAKPKKPAGPLTSKTIKFNTDSFERLKRMQQSLQCSEATMIDACIFFASKNATNLTLADPLADEVAHQKVFRDSQRKITAAAKKQEKDRIEREAQKVDHAMENSGLASLMKGKSEAELTEMFAKLTAGSL